MKFFLIIQISSNFCTFSSSLFILYFFIFGIESPSKISFFLFVEQYMLKWSIQHRVFSSNNEKCKINEVRIERTSSQVAHSFNEVRALHRRTYLYYLLRTNSEMPLADMAFYQKVHRPCKIFSRPLFFLHKEIETKGETFQSVSVKYFSPKSVKINEFCINFLEKFFFFFF